MCDEAQPGALRHPPQAPVSGYQSRASAGLRETRLVWRSSCSPNWLSWEGKQGQGGGCLAGWAVLAASAVIDGSGRVRSILEHLHCCGLCWSLWDTLHPPPPGAVLTGSVWVLWLGDPCTGCYPGSPACFMSRDSRGPAITACPGKVPCEARVPMACDTWECLDVSILGVTDVREAVRSAWGAVHTPAGFQGLTLLLNTCSAPSA